MTRFLPATVLGLVWLLILGGAFVWWIDAMTYAIFAPIYEIQEVLK